jgi:hypothetical protein
MAAGYKIRTVAAG